MKKNLYYNNIIDLEYFCHQDSGAERNELHRRDRNIFLESQKQQNSEGELSNSTLIQLWLAKRVQSSFSADHQKSPGTIFSDAYLLTRNLATIKGIIVGLIAGFSFFSYTGTTPVNVFHFLLFFVVSQLAFACFLIMACLLRLLLPRLRFPSFYSLLLRGIIGRTVSFFHKQWLRNMDAEKRTSVNYAFGIFKAQSTVYGSLFYWPLFALSQLFAIGFNIGLLTATLVKISTSDLAFGWQSTMQFGSEAIHRTVMFVASPWSWFVPEANSYPSLAEIEGSRIILKEGIYHLTTGNLIAWWPFLVFCLLFYGLFLRITLFAIGKLMERRSLQTLKFDTPACLALIRRMQTPLVSTQAAPEPNTSTSKQHARLNKPEIVPPATLNLLSQVVLIPDDIYPLCPAEKLAPPLHNAGFEIKVMHRFMISYDQDQQLKELLSEKQWEPEEGILILMEGWMVPLIGFLSYLKELRAILPKNAIINVGLVGRPGVTIFTPVATEDFSIWQQKIEAAGDPYLNIFSLIS